MEKKVISMAVCKEKKEYDLCERELLILLLGFVLPLSKARQVSKILLHEFSSLNALFAQSNSLDLKNTGLNEKGIDLLKIVHKLQEALLRSSLKKNVSIKSVKDVVTYCRHKIAFEPNEILLVLFLDNNRTIISEDIFYRGTVDSVTFYPRDIFKHAFEKNASSIILVHNHTSGHTFPSVEDVIITQDMVRASLVLNVSILDHIIVGPKDYVSLRSMGLMSCEKSLKNVAKKD